MDKKKLLLLFGALIIAIGTALAARSLFLGAGSPQADAAQVPKGPKVLVAQRALASARWLGEEVLRRSVPLPNHMRLKAATPP